MTKTTEAGIRRLFYCRRNTGVNVPRGTFTLSELEMFHVKHLMMIAKPILIVPRETVEPFVETKMFHVEH